MQIIETAGKRHISATAKDMTPDIVAILMKSSETKVEWDRHAQVVQTIFGGVYPDFWDTIILKSGLMENVAKNFDKGRGRWSIDTGIFGSIDVPKPIDVNKRPIKMPCYPTYSESTSGYEVVIANYTYYDGNRRETVCWSVEDMQLVYDLHTNGLAEKLRWSTVYVDLDHYLWDTR